MFSILFLTSNSEPAFPMLNTFVESQIIAKTPSLPISLSLFEFIFPPIKGSGSIFQSPVCKIIPAGVSILSPLGSRIECVKVMYSILKESKIIVPFNSTILRYFVISIFFSLNFSFTKIAVNGVANILHSN